MSGGHFNYAQSLLTDVAEQIDELVALNDSTDKNEYGDDVGAHFPVDVIDKFKEAVQHLRASAAMVTRIDYLVSGDSGIERFNKCWQDEVIPVMPVQKKKAKR